MRVWVYVLPVYVCETRAFVCTRSLPHGMHRRTRLRVPTLHARVWFENSRIRVKLIAGLSETVGRILRIACEQTFIDFIFHGHNYTFIILWVRLVCRISYIVSCNFLMLQKEALYDEENEFHMYFVKE